MAHNVVKKDYIFATNKVTPTDISPINIGLKVPPLRSVSTNLAEIMSPYTKKSLMITRGKIMIQQLLPHHINMII